MPFIEANCRTVDYFSSRGGNNQALVEIVDSISDYRSKILKTNQDNVEVVKG